MQTADVSSILIRLSVIDASFECVSVGLWFVVDLEFF